MPKKILIILILLSFFSCKKMNEARKVADEFYRYRDELKTDSAAMLCSVFFWRYTDFKTFERNILTVQKKYGRMISCKPVYSRYYSSIDSLSDAVVFKYRITYEKKIMYDSLALIKDKGTYKILFLFN